MWHSGAGNDAGIWLLMLAEWIASIAAVLALLVLVVGSLWTLAATSVELLVRSLASGGLCLLVAPSGKPRRSVRVRAALRVVRSGGLALLVSSRTIRDSAPTDPPLTAPAA